MRAPALLGLLLILPAACSNSPATPTPPIFSSPIEEPQPQYVTLSILDGWSQRAVAGARVQASGTEAMTDAEGHVRVVRTGTCVRVDVVAAGFLDRRTCSSNEVTLWPVADAAERDLTRVAAFHNDTIRGYFWSEPLEVALSPQLRLRDDVQRVWAAAIDQVRDLTRGRISMRLVTAEPREGLIVAQADPLRPVCSVPPPWPMEAGGLCVFYTPTYFLDELQVRPDALADGSVALRGLLWWASVLNPHDGPGLLNQTRPASEISEFERKTLHMIGLRRVDLWWPDMER